MVIQSIESSLSERLSFLKTSHLFFGLGITIWVLDFHNRYHQAQGLKMDRITNALQQLVNGFFYKVTQFDHTTWCVLSVCTVVFGFMLLRGNVIKK